MNKVQKTAAIETLKKTFSESNYFYLTDSSGLTVAETNDLRRLCFEKGVTFSVVKNTLVEKALKASDGDYDELLDLLHGPTSLMVSDVANLPAKILKEFRKDHKKPELKGAYIDTAIFLGEGELDNLSKLKSKEELLGEIIGLLQSPIQSLVSALESGKNTIGGLIKTLEER